MNSPRKLLLLLGGDGAAIGFNEAAVNSPRKRSQCGPNRRSNDGFNEAAVNSPRKLADDLPFPG